jgi:hypothetical protein
MRFNRSDLIGALRDNYEFWKIAFPVLPAAVVACLAIIEFAFSDHPIIFIVWSLTCLISGVFLHRWWSSRAGQEPDSCTEWP